MRTPTRESVESGDLLVVDMVPGFCLLPIVNIREDKLIADGKYLRGAASSNYEDAVVLKKDGTYLVGRGVKGFFTFAEQIALAGRTE